ncbi:MAG: TIGR02996 domain-containing protein [Archangiaceae bacterium]|nr:TIGR02996 domain-containing protein [Archangiaceae bacterium]
MRQRDAFEAAIEAAPDDPQAFAVYGDWLAQSGDARGELIALQLLPSLDRRQRERVKALLYEPGIRCLAGPVAQWRWGFVHTATLMRQQAPGERIELERLLAHPSMRFVRALSLGQEPMTESLRVLEQAAPRVLLALTIYSPRTLELTTIPTTLPALEQLHLSVPELSGTLPALARLSSLEIAFLGWTQTTAKQLFESNGARLRSVKLIVSGEVEPATVRDVLALPALEALTIEASEMGVDAVAALEEGASIERLTTIDLLRSGLTERAAKRVMQLSRRLPKLSSLVLGEAVES